MKNFIIIFIASILLHSTTEGTDLKFWQVDAFTKQIFNGNPAAVFIFDEEPSDEFMSNVAREMNLAETAFVIQGETLKIRWFTPTEEVDLCGHATLASAHILWKEGFISEDLIEFQSKSGPLFVMRKDKEYTLDFPIQPSLEKNDIQDLVYTITGQTPEYIGFNGIELLVVLSDADAVQSFVPNFSLISELPGIGLLLTAQGSEQYDYIYRAFFPKISILEDPVTGTANTSLGPYWSNRLNKTKLHAYQASHRSGELTIEFSNDRVLISGDAITVFEGTFYSE